MSSVPLGFPETEVEICTFQRSSSKTDKFVPDHLQGQADLEN